MIRVLFVFIGYIFGLFQTGFFYGKLKGIDLQKQGSGNTGATNALRVYGWKGGLIVYLFDMMKTFIPCLLIYLLIKYQCLPEIFLNPSIVAWPNIAMAYVFLGCLLGNNFPFFRHFKGGKGVAALSGFGFAWSPIITLCILGCFILIVLITGYVSLGSIIACVLVALSTFLFGYLTWNEAWLSGNTWEFYLIVILACLIIILKHRSNIKRLLQGTENRFGKHKDKN